MWKPEIDDLERRKGLAYRMGTEKNVAKQHKSGRMIVRERIETFVDKDTFLERGILTGVSVYDKKEKDKLLSITPCPFAMGIGRVDDRAVAIHGDDFTIKGASVGRMYKSKGTYFIKMARTFKLPMI